MWILFSILAGFGDALRDGASKWISKDTPKDMVSWSYSLLALPYFLPLLLREAPPELPWTFFTLLTLNSCCHVFGGILLVKALRMSDLSLCVPMVAFTPVFLLVLGPLLTGDTPSLYGLEGALLVVVGCYMLNIGELRRGLLEPLRALGRDLGVRLMLGLSLLWALTGSVDRIAVRQFDLEFWATAQLALICILFVPVLISRGSLKLRLPLKTWASLTLIGAFNALSFATYLQALKIAPVFYVVCVKRSNILFSVILGRLAFGETNTSGRFIGGALMLLGIVVISTWG
jgi:drug/metabolite transporter (DMT)-like permease